MVASEIGNAAIEACKAQAVAARTFVWPYYHAGKIITDDSSKHQAFRAARIDPEKYPRAIQAAKDTAGQVLRYQGSVIGTCSYSASNGGRTVSSEERWGGARPWLIAQDDPLDAAAGGPRTGHGVGMSQRGAKYAASIGVGYREILAFYYPGTDIWTEGEKLMNERAQKTVDLAVEQLGSPYVYGTWGSPCKPALRRKYAGYNPSHQDNIYKVCQVLSGKAENCAGCKYNGRLAFDCRGFTHWILEQVGIDIAGGGATSQYNTDSNWVLRGKIDEMPDLPCCVFKADGNKMAHTGYHIGGGRIIHCSAGVQEGKITDKGWTHYAVPVGLYEPEELASAGVVDSLPTLRRGSSGEAVRRMQLALQTLGYDVGEVDGVYGSQTVAAVRAFQSAHGLTADGICGPATWSALKEAEYDAEDEPDQPSKEPEGDAAALLEAVDAAMEQLREAVKAVLGAVT